MKKIISAILITITCSLYSQDYTQYYLKLQEADKLLYSNKKDLALPIYDSLSTKYKYSEIASFYAAVLYFRKQNYSKSALHFYKLATMTCNIDDYCYPEIIGEPIYFSEKDLKVLNSKVAGFIVKMIEIYNRSNTRIIRELDEKLKEVYVKDQCVRQDIELDENNNCYKTIMELNNKKIYNTDSANLMSIKKIIKKYQCIPNLGMVSIKGLDAFRLLLMHNASSPKAWAYNYCDSLLSSIKKRFKYGDCIAPESYATIIDRRFRDLNNLNYYKQLYDRTVPVFEPEKLNQRRKEIFLLEK